MELTNIEKMLIKGLQARDREIFTNYIQPLQAEYKEAFAEIERQHGLESGAIGTKYSLDVESWTLIEIKQEAKPEQKEQPKQEAEQLSASN